MNKVNKVSRRKFFYLSGLGAAAFLAKRVGSEIFPNEKSYPSFGKKSRTPGLIRKEFNSDVDINLQASPAEISIFPGNPTKVWTYQGQLLKGSVDSFQNMEGSYLGPTIRVRRGQKIRIRFSNNIPQETVVHWHGLYVPADMDGHPRYAIQKGQSYVYEFEVNNRAGTYWYHPHPDRLTGPQVYKGLAGFFIVTDEEEQQLDLPRGQYDLSLVIQDRTFDKQNQLVYLPQRMMAGMMASQGFLGQRILVNGQPNFELRVSSTAYRLRLLNGSNSRIYRLAWEDNQPLIVLGTDGGLLERPVSRQYVMLGPGERIELWADFSQYPVGAKTALISLPFNSVRIGARMMMGRGGVGGFLANGSRFKIFEVKVVKKGNKSNVLPSKLSFIAKYKHSESVNYDRPRTFRLARRHMHWTINGRTFRMNEVVEGEKVRLNTTEAWEFINEESSGRMMGGMMSMPHPMHVHGPQFQVVERRGVRHQGYVDTGWKDTVLVMPGEQVKFLLKFNKYKGVFLYHCHNLEHEDLGMMRNYLVQE